MRLAHVTSTTGILSSKSDVQHLHGSCTQHEKCGRILKHVLKPYDNRSHNQNVRITSCIRSLPDASSARYKSGIRQSKAKVVPSKSALMTFYQHVLKLSKAVNSDELFHVVTTSLTDSSYILHSGPRPLLVSNGGE